MAKQNLTNFAMVKVGDHAAAIVDKEFEEYARTYSWHIVRRYGCIYAARDHVTDRGTTIIFMHRKIARCPRGFVVHHRNKNTLDNRLINLQCCSKDQHRQFHKYGTSIPEIDLEPYRKRDADKYPSSKIHQAERSL